MSATRLREYLDEHGITYEEIHHRPAYTAQEVAASTHVPGKDMAKTVVVKVDGRLALAVLPAAERVDVVRLKDIAHASNVTIALEQDFRAAFPECELGAMPPFGNLYGVPVYVDTHLAEDDRIAFNAGTHTDVMRVAYKDFEKLVHPTVAPLCVQH
ncbi:MAG: YbaK/EbsC family protein [Vicinamibacteraceae bacterium]|nr:YbaK/EbsC family protein [Vicinamibacteraceae bacterium]